jgi:hypothetical protein
MTDLIPDDLKNTLIENGRQAAAGVAIDPQPVVKLFAPWTNVTWYISELSPRDPHIAFGVADFNGEVELGNFDLREISRLEGPGGDRVQRDLYFTPKGTISDYWNPIASTPKP